VAGASQIASTDGVRAESELVSVSDVPG
jgi:hypothetical protein